MVFKAILAWAIGRGVLASLWARFKRGPKARYRRPTWRETRDAAWQDVVDGVSPDTDRMPAMRMHAERLDRHWDW